MVNFTNSVPGSATDGISMHTGKFFAVYDPCKINNVHGSELAFIEERLYCTHLDEHDPSDEKYFSSLKDAKLYVKQHFNSGAEYFSLNQSVDPDNLLHIIVDKITYLVS